MPSPIAHCSLALLGWPALAAARPFGKGRRLLLLFSLLAALVAPDVDILLDPLLFGRPPFATHGGPMHSLAASVFFGVVFALWGRLLAPLSWGRLFLVGAAAWCSHVLLDAATYGRGVMLLWPLTDERFALPVPLFYGVRHSENAAWTKHLITVASETLFALLVFAAWTLARRVRGPHRGPSLGRTHMEAPA